MVRFLLPTLLFWSGAAAQTVPQPVVVGHRQEGAGFYVFIVTNHRPAPYQISVWFPELLNMRADAELPVEVVLPPGMKEYRLFHLRPTGTPHRFQYQYRYFPGDPRTARHEDDWLYQFPFSAGTSHLLGQGYHGAFSHQNEYALDFRMPVGTMIRAARDGIVFDTKDDGFRGGVDPSLRSEANFVRILHRDGTMADYVHLNQFGVTVQIGESVRAGQLIGMSGNTGFSSEPHLHFAVSIPKYFEAQTIPVRFLGPGGSVIVPREGEVYQAVHRP